MRIIYFRLASTLFSIVVTCITSLMLGGAAQEAALITGVALAIVSATAFIKLGEGTFSAGSVTSFCILVFGAGAGIYTTAGYFPLAETSTFHGLWVVLSMFLALQLLILWICPEKVANSSNFNRISDHQIRRFAHAGLLLGAVSTALLFLNVPVIPTPMVTSAIIFLSFSLSFSKKASRKVFYATIVLVMIFAYYELFFSGFGRLNIAALLLSVAAIWSLANPSRVAKWLTLAAVVPMLGVLSLARLAFLEEAQGRIPGQTEGIGSVVGPVGSAGAIAVAHLEQVIQPALGMTLIAAALFWVPSDLWSGKPLGFGREIVKVTQPEHLSTAEFSDAGMVVGEAIWNFGIVGGIVSLFVVAAMVRWVDCFFMNSRRSDRSLLSSQLVVLFGVVAGSMTQVIWGGAFTWSSRTVIPIVIIWLTANMAMYTMRSQKRDPMHCD